jgi:outer membrane protein TolC
MFSIPLRAVALTAAMLPLLATAAPMSLDEAVERALQRSEATRSARAGVASASSAAQAAGQLPDPVLGASLENLPITGPDRLRTARESMTMKRIALSQEWVPQAKRALRQSAAKAMVAREAAAATMVAADTRLQTVLAYIEAYYAAESLQLTRRNELHAREATETARARLAAGGAGAADVLALSSAQGTAADETAENQQQFASASVTLARWTGVPVEDLLTPVLAPTLPEEAFVQAHPLVVTRMRELELARQEAAITAADRRPNWTWEVAYGQRPGFSELLSLGVSIPLPVAPAARQDRQTAAKLALVERAEAELAEATRTAQGEFRALASDAQRLQQRIRNYEGAVIAPAVQRTAAATAGYGSNQAALATVFEARHAELEARRKLLALRRDLAKVQARLLFKPVKREDLQ